MLSLQTCPNEQDIKIGEWKTTENQAQTESLENVKYGGIKSLLESNSELHIVWMENQDWKRLSKLLVEVFWLGFLYAFIYLIVRRKTVCGVVLRKGDEVIGCIICHRTVVLSKRYLVVDLICVKKEHRNKYVMLLFSKIEFV